MMVITSTMLRCHLRRMITASFYQIRYQSAAASIQVSKWQRFKRLVGIKREPMKYRKFRLRMSGLNMYICCTEIPEYNELLTVLQLPDTFNSWFSLLDLHIWLCMTRLASEGRDGLVTRNFMLTNMWEDVEKRIKIIGDGSTMTIRKEGLNALSSQFKASLFGYDEGLLSHDRVLAAALWRHLFQRQHVDPRLLEQMVQYIRKQHHHLQEQPSPFLLQTGLMTFLPIYSDKLDNNLIEQKFAQIRKKKM